MKKIFYRITVLVFAISFLAGCSSGNVDLDSKTLAIVNKARILVEDLRYELKNAPYDEESLLKTKSGRRDYLDRLMEKEILLQEAQRQGLHRERDFMKTIEGYWEQALLKILLERKSDEISSLTHVSDNEIEEYYSNSENRTLFPKSKTDVKKAIRRKKETEAMNAWIEELKKQSYIKINEEILEEVFSGN